MCLPAFGGKDGLFDTQHDGVCVCEARRRLKEEVMGESHKAKMAGKIMLLMHSAHESGCMCNYRV